MFLIVGLGNPGIEYNKTFHNIGFMTVDFMLEDLEILAKKNECQSITYHTNINGEKVIFAKPQTFMNLSGNAVLALKNKYKLDDKDILVVADDIDLEVGKTRYRENGSGGTHNGLRNIVQNIGTDFKRVRIGIGRGKGDLAGFVLSKIPNDTMQILEESINQASEKILQVIKQKN